jgi:hypothetical protein
MPSMSLQIPREAPQHQRWVTMLQDRIDMAKKRCLKQHDAWRKAEDLLVGYVPESELDANRRWKREQLGVPKYTTIKLPYTMALLNTAHTYWTSVFLSRQPIHQFMGRHGESEQQVLAVEALTAYEVEAGRALAPYYLWLYDAGKYGVGILGEYWEKEIIQYGEIVQVQAPDGTTQLMQTTQQLEGYEGVKVYNISPFDFLPDPRVTVANFQKGEFVAVRKELSWNDVLRRASAGYFTNIQYLTTYYGTSDGTRDESKLERPDTQLLNYPGGATGMTPRPAMICVYEVHIDLIPAEWGLGAAIFPQKWCFTITQDYSLILGACPYGYAHGKYLFEVLVPEIEAYGTWTRGIVEQVEPIQNTMDWLLNSHFYNVRASNNNQFIADPSRLMIKDFERGEPGLFIRMRPEAYGQDVRQMFTQIPVADVTRGNISDMQIMQLISDRATGINDQLMGLGGGSSRKTATQVRTDSSFGINRQKTTVEYMSAQGFSAHARKMLACAQQYYQVPKKLRIVGDIVNVTGPQFLLVTPEMIGGDYDFVPVDGTLPIDRMAQANLWKEVLMGMRAYPQLMMEYDITKLFSYIGTLSGLRNMQQFKMTPEALMQQQVKLQLMAPELLQNEASKGNVVPLRQKESNTRTTGVQKPSNSR